MTRSRLLLVGLPALLALALIGGTMPAAQGAPPGPMVRVRTLDRTDVRGTIESLDDSHLTLREVGAAADTKLPLTELIDLLPGAPGERRQARRPDKGEVLLRATLTGGSRLVGILNGPAEDGIVLDVRGLGLVTLPFEAVVSLERLDPDKGPSLGLLEGFPRPESGDLAYDKDEDEYAGVVFKATAKELIMEGRGERKRAIAWPNLLVLHLENDKLEEPQGVRAEVELQDGSRLVGAGPLRWTKKGLQLSLRALPKKVWELPLKSIYAVRWSGGAFVYATELPFESKLQWYYDIHDPTFYERKWGARVGREPVTGRPLTLAGVTYRYGFGVHSRSTITLDLGGNYKSFRAKFGIDDCIAGGPLTGNVDARVLADDKVLWEAKGVRGGAAPVEVGPVDLAGVKKLVLLVDWGQEGMLGDRGDWVDPILVRK